jgi:hypothetical protein
MGHRFVSKWGPEVRKLVEDAALDPARPSARAIHEGLVAGATGENGALRPTDIPPPATVAQWVGDTRRDARDVITGNPDQLDKIAAKLMKKLRDQASRARTAEDISRCAKAARELAGLHRDLNRGETNKGGARPRARLPSASQTGDTEDSATRDREAEFLRGLEDDERV